MNTTTIARELEEAVSRISPSIRFDAQPDPLIDRTILVRVHELEALEIAAFITDAAAKPRTENPDQGRLF